MTLNEAIKHAREVAEANEERIASGFYKLNGICSKCSRMDYCKKPCTRTKRRALNQAIFRKKFRL